MAGFAWQLIVGSRSEARRAAAVDGSDGLFLADALDEVLLPVSNTTAYRIPSTLLTAGKTAPAQ